MKLLSAFLAGLFATFAIGAAVILLLKRTIAYDDEAG